MTTKIKLPPLPHGLTTYEFPDGAYSTDELQAYATAAVEIALASPQVQALRRDAELYRAIKNAAVNDDTAFIDAMQEYALKHFADSTRPTQDEFDACVTAALEKTT